MGKCFSCLRPNDCDDDANGRVQGCHTTPVNGAKQVLDERPTPIPALRVDTPSQDEKSQLPGFSIEDALPVETDGSDGQCEWQLTAQPASSGASEQDTTEQLSLVLEADQSSGSASDTDTQTDEGEQVLASAEDANQGQELGGCLERAAPTDHAGEMDAQAAAALQAAGQACAGAQAAVDFHLALVVKVTPEQGEEIETAPNKSASAVKTDRSRKGKVSITLRRRAPVFFTRKRFKALRLAAAAAAAQVLRQEKAALVIQKCYRAYVARREREARRAAEALRRDSAAITIQRHVRGVQARDASARLLQAAVSLQAAVRARAARRVAEDLRRKHAAAVCIQASVRGLLARKAYKRMQHAAIVMQSVARALQARRAHNQMQQQRKEAALVIQTMYRAYVARRDYQAMRAAAVTVQAMWRGREARRELLRRRAERAQSELLRKQNAAAQVVQAHWRGYMARKEMERLRNEAPVAASVVCDQETSDASIPNTNTATNLAADTLTNTNTSIITSIPVPTASPVSTPTNPETHVHASDQTPAPTPTHTDVKPCLQRAATHELGHLCPSSEARPSLSRPHSASVPGKAGARMFANAISGIGGPALRRGVPAGGLTQAAAQAAAAATQPASANVAAVAVAVPAGQPQAAAQPAAAPAARPVSAVAGSSSAALRQPADESGSGQHTNVKADRMKKDKGGKAVDMGGQVAGSNQHTHTVGQAPALAGQVFASVPAPEPAAATQQQPQQPEQTAALPAAHNTAAQSTQANPPRRVYDKSFLLSKQHMRADIPELHQNSYASVLLRQDTPPAHQPGAEAAAPAGRARTGGDGGQHAGHVGASNRYETMGMGAYRNEGAGRGGRGGRGRKGGAGGGQGYMRAAVQPQQPVQTHSSLHRSEHRYVAGQSTADDPEEEKRQKQILGILNKITPDNFERLTNKIVDEVGIVEMRTLDGLINKIFDKALHDTHFCELYAHMVKTLSDNPKCPKFPPEEPRGKPVDLRRLLVNKCQTEFEKGTQAMDDVCAAETKNTQAAAASSTQTERTQTEASRTARKRMLANITFVGHLYKQGLITHRTVHMCIQTLVKATTTTTPRTDDIECLCKLLTTAGKELDSSTRDDHRRSMATCFDRLDKLRVHQDVDKRLQFLIMDVIDLRRNEWVPRMLKEGPKKIQDIHNEAQREMDMQAQRDRDERQRDRRGGGGGNRHSGPPPARGPPAPAMQQGQGQNVQYNGHRYGMGGQDGGRRDGWAGQQGRGWQNNGQVQQHNNNQPHRQHPHPPPPPPPPPPPRRASLTHEDMRKKVTEAVEQFRASGCTPVSLIQSFALIRKAGGNMSTLLPLVLTCALETRGVDFAQRLAPFETVFLTALRVRVDVGGVSKSEVEAGVRTMMCDLHNLCEDQPKAPVSLGQFLAVFVVQGHLSLGPVLSAVLSVPPTEGEEDPPLVVAGGASDLVFALMKRLVELCGQAEAAHHWSTSGLTLTSFFDIYTREEPESIRQQAMEQGLGFMTV